MAAVGVVDIGYAMQQAVTRFDCVREAGSTRYGYLVYVKCRCRQHNAKEHNMMLKISRTTLTRWNTFPRPVEGKYDAGAPE